MQVQTSNSSIVKKAKRILVIEDNLDFVGSLLGWLKANGHSPTPTRSRDEALNALLSESFPYILMDYRMPGMAAEEFVNLVRKLHPKTILILSTGDAGAYEVASSLGISYVIQKPFDCDHLTSLLSRIATANGIPDA